MEQLIMELKEYLNVYRPDSKYKEAEYVKAAKILSDFFDKLDNMRIYKEDNRKLNELEKFVEIYNFVSNRVYLDQESSHDLVGALLTGKSVCQGFCQLMEFICKKENIPFFYKRITTFDENNDYLGEHGNFEVIIPDSKGNRHCLHCDPTIDCPKSEDDALGYNAFLIEDKNINSYYHTQVSSENFTSFYNSLSMDIETYISKISEINEAFLLFYSKEDIINNKFLGLKNNILKLNEFFKIDFKLDENSDREQIINAYRLMKKEYEKIANRIDPNELQKAILNVCVSESVYEDTSNVEKGVREGIKTYNKRVKKTIDNNQKYWNKKMENPLSLV